MAAAAVFMRAPNGPQIAFVEDGGYDSHSNQARQLQRSWRARRRPEGVPRRCAIDLQDTAVVVITEFAGPQRSTHTVPTTVPAARCLSPVAGSRWPNRRCLAGAGAGGVERGSRFGA